MDFRGKNIDLVGKQNLWFAISALLIVIGLGSWRVFGLNLGIDFKGGGQLQYRIPASKRPGAGGEVKVIEEARTLLATGGLANPKLQIAGGNTLVINTDARGEDDLNRHERIVKEALGKQFTGTSAGGQAQELQLVGRQLVGPVIGRELRRNAINGILLGVTLIALWIYIRYNFAGEGLRYAVAGIVALVHDVLVLIGLFALIGKLNPEIEIDGSFIAALLTVVGYSINDSVVIFDRLRENLRVRRKEPFNKVVNDSLLETMSRSINTGLTVLIMLFVLLIVGGESIYNFVLAMLIGIASGLYSSIFNASMVLTAWNNYDQKKLAAARAARSTRTGQTVSTRAMPPRATAPPRPPLSAATSPTVPAATTPTLPAATTPEDGATAPRNGVETPARTSAAAARSARKARARRRF